MKKKFTALTLILFSVLTLSGSLTGPPVSGLTWSAGVNITPPLTIETKSYVMEDKNGFLWVAYESSRSTNFDIFARRWDGSSFLPEERLTNDPSSDQNPALVQLTNGTILLVWASDRLGGFSLFSKRLNGGVWSAETRLTVSPGWDSNPSLLQARNGTLWVFWTRSILQGNQVRWDVYYKTYTNNVWSQDFAFANTAAAEQHQSVVESDNGTVWVLYSSDQSGNFELYYKTYTGTWSTALSLTNNSGDDRQAWIMQDLNGTMWVFWSRCVRSGSTCQEDIFYRFSYNQGLFWYPEVQFTFDPAGVEINDIEPAAVHARDKKIYLFWTTNITGNGGDWDIYYATSEPIPIHDVGLTNVVVSPTSLRVGGTVRVDVTLANYGGYSEIVRVDGYFENETQTYFGTVSATAPAGRSTKVQLFWSTVGVVPASSPLSPPYRIIVLLQPVPGESIRRQGDNSMGGGNVKVFPQNIPGDLDGNGDVDIIDLAALGSHFGERVGLEDLSGDCKVDMVDVSILASAFDSRPGDPTWNSRADLDGDGDVDINDASTLAIKFGVTAPTGDIDGDCVVDILDASVLAFWFDTNT